MSSYTKLFHSILDSSIWQESHQTRILWVTMLAMADQHGEVQASVPGLAKRAGVTIREAEDALIILLSPDAYSRTPDNEGRRIATIDGGWEILNHAKYRFEASLEDRKEKAAIRSKRFRDRNKAPQALQSVAERDAASRVTHHNAGVTHLPDKAEAEADANKTPLPPSGETPAAPVGDAPQTPQAKGRRQRRLKVDLSNDSGFISFWEVYPKKLSKLNAMNAWAKIMPTDDVVRRIVADVTAKRSSPDWIKDSGQFIPYPATYLNGRRWEDMFEAPETKETLEAKLRAHRGCPSHINRVNATAEDLAEYAEMLKRYKAMP